MEEKKVLTQGAVSLVALIALIVFVEWRTVPGEFVWYQVLYWFPVEAAIGLTLFAVLLSSLKGALRKWIIGPFVRWVGKGT